MGSGDPLQLILLGKTGSGKSALGNKLLRRAVFESRLSASPVTKTLTHGRSSNIFGHSLVIVDTPDMSNRETPETVYTTELPFPGPHAFLFVTSVGEDPNSLEESLKTLKAGFSEEVFRYTILVFTREHDLSQDEDITSPEDYIQCLPKSLRNLIGQCRHIFLDNAAEREDKLRQLTSTVAEMRRVNRPDWFQFSTYSLRSKRSRNGKNIINMS